MKDYIEGEFILFIKNRYCNDKVYLFCIYSNYVKILFLLFLCIIIIDQLVRKKSQINIFLLIVNLNQDYDKN